jgi:ribosomal protein L11 methyltransferase
MPAEGGGWQVTLEVPSPAQLESFDAALETLGGAITAIELDGGPRWRIVVHCAEEPARDALARLVAAAAEEAGIPAPDMVVEALPVTDWIAEYQRNTKPMTIGRFYVYPSHHAHDIPAGVMPILLDAGRAFGTGGHESTAGCLRALDRLAARGVRPVKALDMGCGSGILAIAMALLWPDAAIVACDNDRDAVAVAEENAALNRVAATVRCVAGDGYATAEVAASRPFGLIVANILAGPLTAMAGDLAAALAPGGTAVLSGLLTVQADGVAAAHDAHGLRVADRVVIGDWTTLVLDGR